MKMRPIVNEVAEKRLREVSDAELLRNKGFGFRALVQYRGKWPDEGWPARLMQMLEIRGEIPAGANQLPPVFTPSTTKTQDGA